jgi:hypothetical protein
MTPVDWLVIFVVLVAGTAAALSVTLSNAAVTRAINHLERSYRRQKTLQLEQLQAQLVVRRDAELRKLLGENEAWRGVVQQLLADAFPGQAVAEPAAASWLTLMSVADRPPQFLVGRQDEAGETFLFTTAREEAGAGRSSWLRNLLRLNPVVPLDASLSSTARVEVEAVWRHLAQRRGLEPAALPRQAEWYLIGPRRRHKRAQRP